MKVQELILVVENIKILKSEGPLEIEITGVATDSRKVAQGFVFIAVPGLTVDGHSYIDKAIDKGAVAIICESLPHQLIDGVTYIVVANTARAAGIIAHNYYDRPTEKLKLIGITGTNGKTTIATIMYRLMRLLGHKTGLVSTIEIIVDGQSRISQVTTPDPIRINEILSEMVEAGCDYVFMEVSSHAVVQQRISGLYFTGGIFTNLTHDHLDYHGSFKDYRDTKKMFFDSLSRDAIAISNADDTNGKFMLQNCKAGKYLYSLRSMVDFKGRILSSDFNGLEMEINGTAFHSRLIGKFNAYNLLAVYGMLEAMEFPKEEILLGLSTVNPPAGRFEFIRRDDGAIAIVDYAHTPDALKNILSTVNEIRGTQGVLLTIVGCGGDRDRQKRPEMAKIAAQLSDQVILTSDNPRSEDPEEILRDMESGLEEQETNWLSITDRKQAIKTATRLAKENDVIVVAGKGHEKYQEIKGEKHPFDDKALLLEFFEI
ncbi:MAG: UDP-N-acetylmuramoyl-L-alanyl-D-glutamate--2,6-diaminopimelate ligase [Bacteroidia bacterium]|nr:UDP-N-acetylmuramoyl-L-alanyl-D-glutamate--2,6-diaminopimelate ligase [Bacteroidia bacterium]